MNNFQKKFNNCFPGDFNGFLKVILVQTTEIKTFCCFSQQLLLHYCTNVIPEVQVLFILCHLHK